MEDERPATGRRHGKAGELDPLGADGEDEEADEPWHEPRHVDAKPQECGDGQVDRAEQLHDDDVVAVASPQRGVHRHERDAAVDEEELAELHGRGADQGESPEPEQSRGEVAQRMAERDGALHRDEGAEEPADHEHPVQVAEPLRPHGCADADEQECGVEPGQHGQPGRDEEDGS